MPQHTINLPDAEIRRFDLSENKQIAPDIVRKGKHKHRKRQKNS